ncbi:MFS transporter [Ferrimicrobium acidiphilum]|uniref:MFS transporter n=1 Tax=Ferrimicrobium acidiphilum TaxID=121039 RepID=UPI0023F083F9|nr:MFS transporter [Ferrimicrobium acidiphilum]
MTAVSAGDPPGRWPALAMLAFAMLLAMTTWFSASAVLPQVRAQWHLSVTAASFLTIAVQLGFIVGAVVSAVLSLADLLAPRRLILYGAIGAAAFNSLLVASHGPASALPLRFATGVCLAGVYPPALKAMATWFRRRRGTALGIMVGALTLGSATPQLVVGLGGIGWQTVIFITSLLTLTGGFLAETIGRDGPFPFPKAKFDPTQARRVVANRGVRLASIGYFGHMWELYAMWAWFSVFFADVLADHNGSDPYRGAALATFAVIGIGAVGSWVGGVLSDRWGRTQAAGLAMALSGSTALVIGFTSRLPVPVVFGIGLFWGFWVVADSAQFSAIVIEVSDQSYVGTAVTLQLAVGFVLTVVTIWIVPILVHTGSWAWGFGILAPGPFVGMIAMARLRRAPEAALIAVGHRR